MSKVDTSSLTPISLNRRMRCPRPTIFFSAKNCSALTGRRAWATIINRVVPLSALTMFKLANTNNEIIVIVSTVPIIWTRGTRVAFLLSCELTLVAPRPIAARMIARCEYHECHTSMRMTHLTVRSKDMITNQVTTLASHDPGIE